MHFKLERPQRKGNKVQILKISKGLGLYRNSTDPVQVVFFSFQYTRTLSSTIQNLCEILCKTTEDSYFGWSLEGSPRVFTYQTSSKDFELKQKPWVSGKENYWYTEGQLTQYSWRSFMNNLIIFTDRESNSSTFHTIAKFHIPVSTNNKSWFPLPVPQKQKQVCFHSFITVFE